MALSDLFVFENQGVIPIAIGVLSFIVVFEGFRKLGKFEKRTAVFISFIFGVIVWYGIYSGRIILGETLVGVLLLLVVLVVIFKVFFPFFKFGRKQF